MDKNALYGYSVIYPERAIQLLVVQPTRWQSFKYRAREQWDYIILPSLIFSVAYTTLEMLCKYG